MPANEFRMAVETPGERVRLVRVAGDLDRSAAARVLRLVDAQLDLVTARQCALTDLLLDLESVRSFEPGGLEALRHARHSAAGREVRIHLAGCSARFHLLPLRVRQVLGEFSTFPTVEIALTELTRTGPAPARLRGDDRAEPASVPDRSPGEPGDTAPARRPVRPTARDAEEFPSPRSSPERAVPTPRHPAPSRPPVERAHAWSPGTRGRPEPRR